MRTDIDNSKLDDHERQMLDDIAKYGWHVVGIASDEKYPAWAFSVGLFETFGHPEVLLKGLKVETLMGMVNLVGERVKSGEVFQPKRRYNSTVAENLDCRFQTVEESLYDDYIGAAEWYYGHKQFPLLQCLWPDKSNRLPGDKGYPEAWVCLQEMTSIDDDAEEVFEEPKSDSDWPFNDPKNVAVFTTKNIVREGKMALIVTHDEDDGSWQVLDGSDVDIENAMLISLYSIVKLDPSIAALADLPIGWKAWRTDVSSPWQREKS